MISKTYFLYSEKHIEEKKWLIKKYYCSLWGQTDAYCKESGLLEGKGELTSLPEKTVPGGGRTKERNGPRLTLLVIH